jgi:EAL domain-containing protein (putative c-di-GMP-specific phosphodiesterase class I)
LVPIAINVSVESLGDTDLPDQLAQRVAEAGLDPSWVTIEVTESTAMTDFGLSLETLARLRMKGFGLSIDDYGTGFSSMQQLARIPFTELKIDQVFVTGASRQPILRTLFETSLTLARRLGLKSVAEGIESDADWDLAAGAGCEVAQGYHIARPMPAEDLLGWYQGWRGRPAP